MSKKATKKKINSCRKGKRNENDLCHALNERFGEGAFARIPTSGARSRSVKNKDAKVAYTGDLITPENFRFSIESKSANINIDFFASNATFDKWLKQAMDDAASVDKIPMLCWKQPRKGWVVALPGRIWASNGGYPPYYLRYACGTEQFRWGWIVCRLDALLKANPKDDFWFKALPKEGRDE